MSEQSQSISQRFAVSSSERVPWIGRLGAPILSIIVYFLLGESALDTAGRATAAIGVLMAIFWMTQAMPLPITSLLPVLLFPLAGVLSISEATAPYANEVIFLFLGGFMLALGVQRWGLHYRIALLIVAAVGTKPRNLIAGLMIATAFLSMWISNTATAVLMLPIAISIVNTALGQVRGRDLPPEEDDDDRPPEAPDSWRKAPNFATGLMLAVAYSASIGGVITLISTPPILLMRAYLQSAFGIEIGFARWMLVGFPFAAVFLFITWVLLTRVLYPPEIDEIPGGWALIKRQREQRGPLSRGEKSVLVVFAFAASAWILREPLASWDWLVERQPWITDVTDPGIAIAAGIALFMIPVNARKGEFVMNWEAMSEMPWNVLLLFGGGLSLAAAIQASGVDQWIGDQVTALEFLPTLLLTAAAAALVLGLTELNSNTATAATFLPVLGGVAIGINIEPILLIVPAALAASCTFMMPVATPPNAIVYSTGMVHINHMIRAGIWLNLIALVLITLVTATLVPWVLG